MARPTAKPVVILPCDHRLAGEQAYHSVAEKYILGASEGAGALPLLLPVLAAPLDIDALLDLADGIMLTGSPSNVAPHRYGGNMPRENTLLDERRDATTLALIRRTLERGVPLFAICRGFQELNVALGGTLHQHVQEIPGRLDHRAPSAAPLDVQYGPSHPVSVLPDGPLAAITGATSFQVNSLHGQGIDRLAESLRAEAYAPDGTIEAVSVKQAKGFALGVQWHPEWKISESPVSRALFSAYAEALRVRQNSK